MTVQPVCARQRHRGRNNAGTSQQWLSSESSSRRALAGTNIQCRFRRGNADSWHLQDVETTPTAWSYGSHNATAYNYPIIWHGNKLTFKLYITYSSIHIPSVASISSTLMNYQNRIKKISVISLAHGKARQRKNILMNGAEHSLQCGDDRNHPYTAGKLCVVRSAYVLLTTGAEVVTFPDLSSETLLLSTLSSVFSFFFFSGEVVKDVPGEERVVLSTNLSLMTGIGDSVAVLPPSSAAIFVAVTASATEVSVAFFWGLICSDELSNADAFADFVTKDESSANDAPASAEDESSVETSIALVSWSVLLVSAGPCPSLSLRDGSSLLSTGCGSAADWAPEASP